MTAHASAKAQDLRHQAATLHTELINNRTTLSIVEAREKHTRMRRALAEAAAIEAELSARFDDIRMDTDDMLALRVSP